MELKETDEDTGGKRWNFEDNGNKISLFEIKKGFTRGW